MKLLSSKQMAACNGELVTTESSN